MFVKKYKSQMKQLLFVQVAICQHYKRLKGIVYHHSQKYQGQIEGDAWAPHFKFVPHASQGAFITDSVASYVYAWTVKECKRSRELLGNTSKKYK